ncbi:MAG: hypothetical protein NTV82_13350 [Candidatus Aminicenantes bacterium]|nr:hypothetical protein [Candidatus Aminicenantes bacterium]
MANDAMKNVMAERKMMGVAQDIDRGEAAHVQVQYFGTLIFFKNFFAEEPLPASQV